MTELRPGAAAPDARASALLRIYDLLRIALLTVAAAFAIWLFGDVLMVLFAATLLAVILHGVARSLARVSGMPFWLSLMLVVLGIVLVLVGLGLVAGPGLSEQAAKLQETLVQQGGALRDKLSQSQWGRVILDQVPRGLGGQGSGGGGIPSGLAGSVAGFLSGAFGLLGTLAVILIAALYFAASPGIYLNGALRLLPERQRGQAKELLETAGHALWSWSIGQAVDMVVVGLLSGLGLWMIGVPLALVLGVIAGLLNFVPYIGAIAGAVPAVIIAFSVGPSAALWTVALYAVIQGFEGNVMAPMIQRRAVDLPPALTILSQTAFGAILGLSGLIFATPITAALLAMLDKATPPLADKDRI